MKIAYEGKVQSVDKLKYLMLRFSISYVINNSILFNLFTDVSSRRLQENG